MTIAMEVRPVHNRRPDRVINHVRLCFLAYPLLRATNNWPRNVWYNAAIWLDIWDQKTEALPADANHRRNL